MPEKEEWYINMIDERKQYIRAKSGQIAYQIMTFVLLGISFILAVFQAKAWIIAMLFQLTTFEYIIWNSCVSIFGEADVSI